MSLAFTKYEGIGNDFILVEGAEVGAALARELCDRHFGIGADGVLLVGEQAGMPAMRVINADGSEPEMCGNGIRCVALHLLRRGRVGEEPFAIATAAGPHSCRVLAGAGTEARSVEVGMRHASLEPAEIGVSRDQRLLEAPLEVGGKSLRVTAVSMGNPHAVTFDDIGAERAVLGPLLSQHPSFARGANAGFARMRGPVAIELFVHERGAGWTLACGTGACAAAVAAVETGRAPRGQSIEVTLPGGALEIVVPALGQPVRMTGRARHVFDGTLPG